MAAVNVNHAGRSSNRRSARRRDSSRREAAARGSSAAAGSSISAATAAAASHGSGFGGAGLKVSNRSVMGVTSSRTWFATQSLLYFVGQSQVRLRDDAVHLEDLGVLAVHVDAVRPRDVPDVLRVR